jgi:hypothetical protein
MLHRPRSRGLLFPDILSTKKGPLLYRHVCVYTRRVKSGGSNTPLRAPSTTTVDHGVARIRRGCCRQPPSCWHSMSTPLFVPFTVRKVFERLVECGQRSSSLKQANTHRDLIYKFGSSRCRPQKATKQRPAATMQHVRDDRIYKGSRHDKLTTVSTHNALLLRTDA